MKTKYDNVQTKPIRTQLALLASLSMFVLAPMAQANFIATLEVTGNWSAGSTWNGGVVPGASDNVLGQRNCTVAYGSSDNYTVLGVYWGHSTGSTKNSILNMSGGTLTSTGDFNVGESAGGTLNQTGGTINAASGKIGNYYSQGNSALTWNLTGPGAVAITGNFRIGYNQGQSSGRAGNCTFTQSGSGSSVSVGGNLTIGTTDNNASAIGRSYVYNLSDGTLAVAGTVQFDPLGTRQFNFTGGTLSFGTWDSANSAPELTNAGGTLSPGLEGVAMTSTIKTNYVQTSGNLSFDVGDAAKDLIEVTGDATLTGTLNLAELGTLTPDTWYTVLTTTGTITDTLTLADPANWTKQVVGSNTLQVKAGATPQTAILSTVSADPATVTVDNSSTITVTLKDSASHFLSGKNVSLAKLPGPGTPTITTLIGTTGGDGIATFKVESTTPGAYIFQATDDTDSVTINQTATVTFTVGAVAKLAFTTQPGNGIPDSPLATQPKVTLQDAYGNTVTGTAQDVTVEIQDNAGPGGVLSGTKTVAVDTGTGVATFSGLSIDLIGTDYTLTATGSTVNTSAGVVVSSPFSVLARPVGWWWTNQVTGVWSAASTWRDGGGWPTTTGDYAGADRNCTVTYGSGDNHSITGFEWGHNPGDATSSILNMTGGTLAVAGTGAWFSLGASGGATLNQSGGTINVGTDAQIGQYYSQGNMPISWNLTGPGTVAITGNFRIGYNQGQSSGRAGNCTFTQSGSGSSVSVGGNLTIGTTDNNASAIGRSYVYNLSDGTLAVAGTVQFDPLGTRQFNFTGGTLSFGTWDSANSAPELTNAGGTLSPGLEGVAMTSTIKTNYVQTSGTLSFDVGDAAKDLIEVTGDATLTGTLNLAELGTLTPDTWYTVLTTTGTITDNLTLADPANWAKQVVDSNILQVKKTSGALVGYASWAGGHAFDSFNTEGVAYGMAWILGAATNSSPSIGLLPKVLNANGSGFTLHLTRVLDAGTAHLYLEYSDTLTPGSWTSIEVPVATGTVSGVVVTVGTSGGLYDITAQIPLGSTGKRFARLAATE